MQTHPRIAEWRSSCVITRRPSILPEAGTTSRQGAHNSTGQPATVSSARNPRLDNGRLDSLVRSFFIKGLAQSTHKVYSSGQRRFLNFCTSAGLQAVPAGEDVLCKFAAKMASEGLRHRTIKSYMAGIRHLHIEEGLDDPFLPTLSRLHYYMC